MIYWEIILFFIGILFICFRNKLSYVGLLSITLCVSIPDLYYVTNMSNDLFAYFKEMDVVQNYNNIFSMLSLYNTIPSFLHHKLNFIYNIFQWLIARTDIFTLLPFCVVLIIYLSISYPFLRQRIKYNVSFLSTIIGILSIIALFPYDAISSTVRWNLAAGLFFLITYLYCNVSYKYEKFVFILYIPLLFIHEAMFLPIMAILICTFMKKLRLYHYVFIGLLLLFSFVIVKYAKVGSGSLLDIAYNYVSGDTSLTDVLPRFTMWVQYFLIFITPYLYAFGGYLLIKSNSNLNLFVEKKLLELFIFIDVVLMPFLIISQRYSLYVGMMGVLIYAKVLKQHGRIDPMIKLIYAFSGILTVIVCTLLIPVFMDFDFSHIYHGLGMLYNIVG